MLESLRTARGVLRSLRVYYGHRQRRAAMDRLYGQFVRDGDLVFDAGEIELKVNVDNPTVSTASGAFVDAAHGAAGWEGQVWGKSIRVPMTTLDALMAAHGRPVFMKIDVEGFEGEALAGMTQPVKALSFEFTTIQRNVARECIERCAALGYAQFNAALGESQELGAWRTADEITGWLDGLPHAANSGDIYARLD
jgi:hypothetical protein